MSAPETSLWARLVSVPREGTAREECQDAADFDLERRRFALADGATESWNAALWARLLVEGYVSLPTALPVWSDWLDGPRQTWIAETDRDLKRGPNELDWFLEDRYHLGAYATFLGLCLTPLPEEPGFSWAALALGDTCLFQMRGDHLLSAFPIERSADFDSIPWLVGSRGGDDVPRRHTLSLAGRVLPGDRLLLMTDALACWFLAKCEQGEKPWRLLQVILDAPNSVDAFRLWVGGKRTLHHIRNDDTTLLSIDVRETG